MSTSAKRDVDARWQDVIMLTAGIILLASPFVMLYPQQFMAHNAFATGLAIVIFSFLSIFTPGLWEEAVLLMLGCWSVASPWMLSFADNRSAALIIVAAGGIVLILALWAMKDEDRMRKQQRSRSG